MAPLRTRTSSFHHMFLAALVSPTPAPDPSFHLTMTIAYSDTTYSYTRDFAREHTNAPPPTITSFGAERDLIWPDATPTSDALRPMLQSTSSNDPFDVHPTRMFNHIDSNAMDDALPRSDLDHHRSSNLPIYMWFAIGILALAILILFCLYCCSKQRHFGGHSDLTLPGHNPAVGMNMFRPTLLYDGANGSESTLDTTEMMPIPQVIVTPPTLRAKVRNPRKGLAMAVGNDCSTRLPLYHRGGEELNSCARVWQKYVAACLPWSHKRNIMDSNSMTRDVHPNLPRGQVPILVTDGSCTLPGDRISETRHELQAPSTTLDSRQKNAATMLATGERTRAALGLSPDSGGVEIPSRKSQDEEKEEGSCGPDQGTVECKHEIHLGKQPMALLMMRTGKKRKVDCVEFKRRH